MTASNLTTVAYIYKTMYAAGAVGDLAMRDHPLFMMMPKNGGFGGTTFNYAIRYANPQGVSGTFADAQTGASGSKGKQPLMYRRKKYGIITLDGEALQAAKGDRAAFLDLVTQETDGVIEEVGDSLAFDMYRDGTGRRGQRASISTDIVTLALVDDARNFKEGMTVIASPNADGTSPRSGETTVVGLDEDEGTVTLASAAAIVGFADNDYLFRKGDPGTCIEGLALQLPLVAPTAGDNFRGMDRSSDTRRLAGIRVDDTATPIVENIGTVAVKISQIGKRADCCYLNPIRMWEVARLLDAKVEYEDAGGTADYGFQYIMVHTPAGTIKVISDPDCPTNRGYVMKMKATSSRAVWYVKHLLSYPHIITDDGNKALRLSGDDGIEGRVRSMGNLACAEPGCNGVFSI
jgi:hypothetical protein